MTNELKEPIVTVNGEPIVSPPSSFSYTEGYDEMTETKLYGGMSAEHLKQFIERLERLAEEKQNISEDIKEVFQEVKSNGFDVKTVKEILKIRKIEAAELEEAEYLLDTYMRALGMKIESEED